MKLINQVLLFYLLTAPLLYGQLYSIELKILEKEQLPMKKGTIS